MAATVAIAQSAEELEKLFRFRYRIYVEDMGMTPPEADHRGRTLRDAYDDLAVNYVLRDGEDIVGSLRLIYLSAVPEPESLVQKFRLGPAIDMLGADAIVTTSRFMLDPKVRHGLGIFRLMAKAYEDGNARGVRLNYGDCSPHLVPFYERMGYRRYARAFNDPAYGFKVPIVMLTRDRSRFAAVGSPLARVAPEVDDEQARTWYERHYTAYANLQSAALCDEGEFFDHLTGQLAEDPRFALGLLQGMSRDEAEAILRESTTVKAAVGDRIIRQGERGDSLFVLMDGVAEVVRDEAPDTAIALLGPGDSFGELAFLTSEPRTANIVARSPCEMLVLAGDFLHRVIAKEPEIASKALLNLSRALAARLAATTTQAVVVP